MKNPLITAAAVIATAFACNVPQALSKKSSPDQSEPFLEGPIINPSLDAVSSGTESAGDQALYYGDNAGFVQRNVLLGSNERSYVTVICTQGNDVVYQASQWGADLVVFTLADLGGQGLDWDPAAGPAACDASLIINEKRGKKVTITTVDQISFDVM